MADATKIALRNPVRLFEPYTACSDSETWKKIIGNRPVCSRLATLPEAKPRWSALFASTILQTAVTAFVIVFPVLFPGNLVNKSVYEAVFIAPQTEVVLPQTQPVVHATMVSAPPATVDPPQQQSIAKLIAPRPFVPAHPEPAPVDTADIPTLNPASSEMKFAAPPSDPARPREPVQLGTLAATNVASMTANKPLERVQTGGFGDPNGLPADASDKRGNIPRFGSAALPPGPGYGNGAGGVTGTRGLVVSAGFGNDAEISSGSTGSRGAIKPGSFETATVDPAAPRPKPPGAPPAVQPMVILEKPDPVYSDEARRLGLEGEVLVEVIFQASGDVRVLRVANGLGHGLDEAAVRAAQQIRFKPALQNGKPADFPATVHIQFQLAF